MLQERGFVGLRVEVPDDDRTERLRRAASPVPASAWGSPTRRHATVRGASVTGEVVGAGSGPKVIAFRFRRRKNIRKKRGHRQHYTRVKITGIQG